MRSCDRLYFRQTPSLDMVGPYENKETAWGDVRVEMEAQGNTSLFVYQMKNPFRQTAIDYLISRGYELVSFVREGSNDT